MVWLTSGSSSFRIYCYLPLRCTYSCANWRLCSGDSGDTRTVVSRGKAHEIEANFEAGSCMFSCFFGELLNQ